MLRLNSNYSNLNFQKDGGKKVFQPPAYSANQFITDLNSQELKRLKGNFISRNIGSPTAAYGSLGIVLLGEIVCFAKKRSLEKMKFPLKKHISIYKNKISTILGATIATALAFFVVVQAWQNKLIDKDPSILKEYLEKYGADTSAKLSDDNLRSTSIGAQYNSFNGVIEVNKNYIHDPIGKKLVEKYMKHELQHARQFEMIAGLDNGLEKLNFASIYSIAIALKNNQLASAQINDIISDVNNDKTNKYDNIKVPLSGAYVDFKKYVKALEIIINNPEAKPEDIPMLIDVAHYKKALKKRGPLSEKEKIQAEKYYQAALEYPAINGLNLMFSFFKYRSNILEEEARRAGRAKNGKIDT